MLTGQALGTCEVPKATARADPTASYIGNRGPPPQLEFTRRGSGQSSAQRVSRANNRRSEEEERLQEYGSSGRWITKVHEKGALVPEPTRRVIG